MRGLYLPEPSEPPKASDENGEQVSRVLAHAIENGQRRIVSEAVMKKICYGQSPRGVVAAHHVYQPDPSAAAIDPARDVEEIRRLMEGFASELQKLEEGLRIVSAYVGRMQSKAGRERGAVH